MGSKMLNTRLWAVIICIWYHDYVDGPTGDVTSETHSCMNTITKGNSWHNQWSTSVASSDKLSSNNGVVTGNRRQAWPGDPVIKSSHRLRWLEEPSSRSNLQSDIINQEDHTILLRILSTYIQNYFFIFTTRIRSIWVHGDQHVLSTHTRWSSQPSAISFNITMGGV
jgi:hypothetical protein